MEQKIDRRIGAASAVMRTLHWSVVVKRELSQKAKLSIYRSIFIPTLTYGHELWVMTERTRSRVQAAKMSFLRRVAGLSLRDRVRSSAIREELAVEPLLLRVERSQMRWLVHLVRMPPGRLPGEVFRACPSGNKSPPRRRNLRGYHGRTSPCMECTPDKLRKWLIEKTYQWLAKAGLKDSTEALLMAPQEQALSTKAIEARVYHTTEDPGCRLCGDAPETVQHITAGCKMFAGKAYMERHNQVAGIVYRNICTEYGLEVPGSRWETTPKVLENKQAKILWDFQIQTDKMVVANQPDVVVVDKHQKTLVVIAIPSNSNIKKKQHEKLEKYQGLKEEMERMWGMKATVVPVVIETLGAVTPKILRRTLRLPGLWSRT
ncbi:hypothetical protein D4764_15G0008870 [Takifugu flavidus]|uniref:Reverse transcriptase zinc-binding domain-containing protein n=1 Tax=Takifugu flavidus TaxID=433684 RepID=A0A5C6P1S6_9TELE|nr:hypothetical protein D4764_15G0008870 [Takifugu flavidus]